MDKVVKEFEDTALLGAKAVREFLTYQGTNKVYFDKARVGGTSMSAYARLRATVANEESLKWQAERLERRNGRRG